jgi:hypothetical protein
LDSTVEKIGKISRGGERGGVRVFVLEAGLMGGIELGKKSL